VTTSRRYYASSTGCPSESVLSSKWHALFASRCPRRRLSSRQMIAASCLTVLDALYVSWCPDLRDTTYIQQLWRQNFCSRWTSFVELFTGPTAQSRHHLRTASTTAEGTPFGNHGHGDLWLLICSSLEEHLLTYLLHDEPNTTIGQIRSSCLFVMFVYVVWAIRLRVYVTVTLAQVTSVLLTYSIKIAWLHPLLRKGKAVAVWLRTRRNGTDEASSSSRSVTTLKD